MKLFRSAKGTRFWWLGFSRTDVLADDRPYWWGGQSTTGIFQQINQISIFDCENVNLHDICYGINFSAFKMQRHTSRAVAIAFDR